MDRMTMQSTVMSRRSALIGLGSMLALAACGPKTAGQGAANLVDLRGRPVRALPEGGKLSIDDGRYLIALSLIHPDPVSLLAAWSGDINRISPEVYGDYLAKFPKLAQVAKIAQSGTEFNAEAVLAAHPDTAVVSLGAGPTPDQAAQLEAGGISVAYIDFFTKPFEHQSKSLALLGAIIGRSEQAAAFNSYKQERLDRISARVKDLPADKRPTVFIEPHAMISPDCCASPGKGNIGEYIDFVGGHNIGADVLDTPVGKLNLEYVIERNPDIYIATGGPQVARAGGFVVGQGFTPEQSQAGLQRVTARTGIATLKAVKDGRAHGLSHQLINSPIDVVAVEILAKWIHPELFGDLNPRATLDEINTRFLAVPYKGEYWADLAR